jgi:hypothetical protein
MLREVAELDVVAELAFATLRFQDAGDQFEERGLACAVRTD